MGFFDRLFRRRRKRVDFHDPSLNEIWENLTDELSSSQLSHFVEEAQEVFTTAYVDEDVETEERTEARHTFEGILSEYAIDISEFDWDAWRDWYEGS